MLRPSFVPPAEIRDLRQLTRLRAVLMSENTRHRNRVEKVLEDALLKITSVLSDVFGASGRRILSALVAGQTSPTALAKLADSRVRAGERELVAALTGRFRPVHATEIAVLLELIDTLQAKVDALDEQIAAMVAELPGAQGVCTSCGLSGTEHAPCCPDLALPILSLAERLDEITGVGVACAHVIIAELGTDVAAQFPTAGHAAAWARLVPLADQSGATTKSGKTGKGNRWLRGALGAAATRLELAQTHPVSPQLSHNPRLDEAAEVMSAARVTVVISGQLPDCDSVTVVPWTVQPGGWDASGGGLRLRDGPEFRSGWWVAGVEVIGSATFSANTRRRHRDLSFRHRQTQASSRASPTA